MHKSTKLRSLRLISWRRFVDETIYFNDGFNVILGENGSGKSSCLEALSLLSSNSELKRSCYADIIRDGSSTFALDLNFIENEISNRLQLSGGINQRKAIYNGTRISNWKGIIPSIAWGSDDYEIVTGSSSFRRAFMDEHLTSIDPLYAHNLHRYTRAVHQRNCLVKNNNTSSIIVWEEMMSIYGGYICHKRHEFINKVNKYTLNHDTFWLFKGCIELTYKPSVLSEIPDESGYDESLRKACIDNRKKDCSIGYTSMGPHRDDIYISINSKAVRNKLSRGQSSTLASLLRKVQYELTISSGITPVIMIDEIFMGLDDKFTSAILELFTSTNSQVIAATIVDRKHIFDHKSTLIQLSN